MTDAERDAGLARLDPLREEIAQTRLALDALYDERRELFVGLSDAGVAQAELARRSGVTPMVVSWAVRKERDPHTTAV